MQTSKKIESVIILEKTDNKPSKISLKYFRKDPIILEDPELINLILLFWIGQTIGASNKIDNI